MNTDMEIMILQNLLQDRSYSMRVLPHMKKEYFSGEKRILFEELCNFVKKYRRLPAEDELSLFIADSPRHKDPVKENALSFFPRIFKKISTINTLDYLVDATEKWCQEQAMQLAILKSVEILDGREKSVTKDGIPKIVQEALAVSFNKDIGHEYFDVDDRFAWYQRRVEKIPYGIDIIDTITHGGFEKKTLNLFIGGTHAGKTLCLCDLTAKMLLAGERVLYITLEIAEEKVAQRIDANLLKVAVNDVPMMMENAFKVGLKNISVKTNSDLIIKEFPNGTVHAGHFRALLDDLERKKGFVPWVLVIDYLNLCASENTKDRGSPYTYYKAVSEELRSLAMERNIAIWSATQLNRTGFTSSDPGLGEVSDSFGVAMTADFAVVIYQDDALRQMNQYMCKQEKNRYGDKDQMPRFLMGVDKSQMRIFDVQQNLTSP